VLQKINTFVAVIAIICITVVTLYGLSKGLDGTSLLTSIMVIAGLGGYIYRASKSPPTP
jgi:small-conductance mechanosensitive channel